MKENLVIAFSGGKTSAFMTYILLRDYSDKYNFIVVFANTGKEKEETLEFVRDCDIYFGFKTIWIEAVTNYEYRKGVSFKIVDFNTASRNGEPFEASIKKHGISNNNAPMCSRELKTYAINSYIRSLKLKQKSFRAIGIRADEIDRISKDYKKKRYIYPLISMFETKKVDVLNFWLKQSFTLRLQEHQGNCDFCYKKSFKKLFTIARENPEVLQWWINIEEKYSDFVPDSRKQKQKTQKEIHFNRKNLSVKYLLELSKLTDEEIKKILKVKSLEKEKGNCSESCEPF